MKCSRTGHWARVIAAVLASVACAAAAQTGAVPRAGDVTASGLTVALVLPSQGSVYAPAAEAVRQGFFAAHRAVGGSAVIQVLEVDDDAAQAAALEGARERGVRVAVGPLTRSAVNAVVSAGRVPLPLVTLNYPDSDGAAPDTLLAFGLSAEAEAQYVVRLALSDFVGVRQGIAAVPRFIVVTGAGGLQRRVAQSFVSTLRAAGEPPLLIDSVADALERLVRLIDPARHDAVFLALNSQEAALVRALIPRQILVFGTSLLNLGIPAGSASAIALSRDLDAVRFVDAPWLIAPSAPGMAALPPPPNVLAGDLARLYALGADAYRIALRWSAGETRFTLEGATGRLRVDRSASARVDRTPALAIFRGGTIERDGPGR